MNFIKCDIKEYYGDGISLDVFHQLIYASYNNNPSFSIQYIKENKNKEWELKYYKKNLNSLGYFESKIESDYPSISPRGKSLLFITILKEKEEITKEIFNKLSRFILLKAIVDIDYDCFFLMLKLFWIDGKKPGYIRSNYFNYDKYGNWRHRWSYHKKLLIETKLPEMLKSLNIKDTENIDIIFNPYNKNFKYVQFFQMDINKPKKAELLNIIKTSLNDYLIIYPKDKPIAYTEVLKTIIQTKLITNHLFINENELSTFILQNLTELNISLYRSSKDRRKTGRGFYSNYENTITYPYFENHKYPK